MNPSRLFLWATPVLLALGVVQPAPAQYNPGYAPYSQPRVSPYINLLRSGTSPGINYYGIVRPEIDFRSGIQQLGVQTRTNEQAINNLQTNTGLPTTGHTAGFQTHLSYFQNIGAPGQTSGFAPGLGGQGQTFGGQAKAGGAATGGPAKR
jgi:hypothetical protein